MQQQKSIGAISVTQRQAVILAVLSLLAFIGLQIWSSLQVVRHSGAIVQDLTRLQSTDAASEKTRQEAISLRIANERNALFLATLANNLAAAFTAVVAIIGAWVGFSQYLGLRRKERLERAAIDLNELWKGLTDEKDSIRAGSVAGLHHFLSPDNDEYHRRISSALAVLGRMNNGPITIATLTPVLEFAIRNIQLDVLRSISWQRLILTKPNFSKLDLSDFDFRDSSLRGVNFTRTSLRRSRFDAAKLNDARFDGAILAGANLEFADLENASLTEADLKGCALRDIKILGTHIKGADLTGATFSLNTLNWALLKDWRDAKLDNQLMQQLLAWYGPAPSGPRVLMLMWEFPPFVSGGGWTAAYHLVTNLRRLGANIVIMVPWNQGALSKTTFGSEVEVIGVGPSLPVDAGNSMVSQYSAYSQYSSGDQNLSNRPGILDAERSIENRVASFIYRVTEYVRLNQSQFDVIHAHDWLCFGAAAQISNALKCPWVAHFHSTERDRRPNLSSTVIEGEERSAYVHAQELIAPSSRLATTVTEVYAQQSSLRRVSIVPNCLSRLREPVPSIGEFGTKRVVFIGRLSAQKGPELFVQIARSVRLECPDAEFIMYGDGDERRSIVAMINKIEPSVPISVSPYDWELRDSISLIAAVQTGEDGKLTKVERLSDREARSVTKLLYQYGCEVVTEQAEEPFTHRVMFSRTTKMAQQQFLIATNALLTYSQLSKRFVQIRGALPWEDRATAYDGATVIVVPSRSEPFGMVILEAMQYGVPVIFPSHAGVAEQIVEAGVKFDADKVDFAVAELVRLLGDRNRWMEVKAKQLSSVQGYAERGYETSIIKIWQDVIHSHGNSQSVSPAAS